MQALDIVKASF